VFQNSKAKNQREVKISKGQKEIKIKQVCLNCKNQATFSTATFLWKINLMELQGSH